MKKIITTIAFIALSTVSAKAMNPDLGIFSLTAGVASNSGVFGASAKETNLPDGGTINGDGVSQTNNALLRMVTLKKKVVYSQILSVHNLLNLELVNG